jgi:transposase
VSERKPYPSDLSDERWAVIEPVITGIFYQSRTGCQWDYLPHDLPPRSAVYYYFARWRDDGTDQAIHDLLRSQARKTGDG